MCIYICIIPKVLKILSVFGVGLVMKDECVLGRMDGIEIKETVEEMHGNYQKATSFHSFCKYLFVCFASNHDTSVSSTTHNM